MDKKSQKKRTAHLWRAICLPLLTVLGILLICFVAIPAVFGATAQPRMVDVDALPQPALAQPTPGLQPEVAALEEEDTVDVSADAALEGDGEAASGEIIGGETKPAENLQQGDSGAEDKPLQFGDSDELVIQIQERLMQLCYMDSEEPTDYFGPATEAALKRFQRVHYMTQTGVADELTQSILFSDSARIYTLEPGNSGDDVDMLQERLEELGYYEAKTNGYFGTATTRALKAFQVKNEIEATGAANQDTRDVLYSSRAKPKIDPTPTPTPKPTKKPSTPRPKSTARPDSGGDSGGNTVIVTSGESSADGLIAVAKAQQGRPYVWSNEGPDSFDCSGLVYYCLRACGVSVGRYSAAGFSEVISWEAVSGVGSLQPGDLIFFKSDSSSRISHTGIWLGGNKYIHASSTAGKVLISSWSNWAERNFVLGRRVF